jgi:hypothetical protein
MTRVLVSLLLGATFASAADQTILGSQLLVKNPSTPEKRTVVGKAKESASSNTIVGNPTDNGATLTVRAEGTTSSAQTFELQQGTNSKGKPFWTGDALAGFKYKDPGGTNGAVKQAQLKKSGNGVFTIKFTASGKLGTVSVLPPNVGNGGCILLELTGGDSYSVAFDDGEVSNKDGVSFKVKKPVSEGSCVTSPTFDGPAFPPVGGSVDFSLSAGNPNDAGGRDLSFSNFSPTTWTALYWGPRPTPDNPTAGLDGSQHALPTVSISGGGTIATFQGTSPWTNPSDMTLHIVPIRLTLTLVSPPSGVVWVDSTTIAGLDPGPGSGIGAVVNVAPSGSAQNITVKFEYTADVPTDDPTGFIPFGTVPTTGGGQTVSSFNGGFYSQP